MPASRPSSDDNGLPRASGRGAGSPAERRAASHQAQEFVARLASQPALRQAIGAVQAHRLADAERIVRHHLAQSPEDVAALCLLGDLAVRAGVLEEGERLFRRALDLLPAFTEARLNLARVLSQRDALPEAIALLDSLVEDDPDQRSLRLLRLSWLGQLGAYEQAKADYPPLLERWPDWPEAWTAYGHLLGTLGDLPGAVAAYRQAIDLSPPFGEAWWGLANLKVAVFDDDDLTRLTALVDQPRLDSRRRSLLHFALAKALQDASQFEGSFRQYVIANALRSETLPRSADPIGAEVERSIAFFTPARLAAVAPQIEEQAEPIFIVGMPRSGSTLVEQILASHPLVEGTSELPYIPMLVHRLMSERRGEGPLRFPEVLDSLTPTRLKELGQVYLDAARPHRREGTPFFIDKLPDNWRYAGFIRMILPNARIVDARREPVACLWSNFRQWFARGQDYSYDFTTLIEQYRQYERLMAHFDATRPGMIRRVQHEELLARGDDGIRDILDRLGLPFAEACLRFHDNARPVRTASAQQVRRPLARGGAPEWTRFRPWIDEFAERMRAALPSAVGEDVSA